MFFCDFAGDVFWAEHSVDFRRHRHGLPGLIWRVSCVQTLSLKRKEFIEAAQVGGVSTASIQIRHIVP